MTKLKSQRPAFKRIAVNSTFYTLYFIYGSLVSLKESQRGVVERTTHPPEGHKITPIKDQCGFRVALQCSCKLQPIEYSVKGRLQWLQNT